MTTDGESGGHTRFGLGSWSDILWLAAISSTLLLTLLPFSSYIVSVPFVRDEWTMSNTEAAVVFSAYLVGSALSALFLLPVTDRVPARKVLLVSIVVMLLAAVGATAIAVNPYAAAHVFLGAFVYGVVYTVWLKRRTWMNIVVGGLAGSFAVLAGAAAVDPSLGPAPIILAVEETTVKVFLPKTITVPGAGIDPYL